VVNSLMAIKECVFSRKQMTMPELVSALQTDFDGQETLQRQLFVAPKWGNGDDVVDTLATDVTEMLYSEFRHRTNPRGGRWQLALYSFVANVSLGAAVGASADGRKAGAILTRNLNPSWGTDRQGPTATLRSLSNIDFTKFPNGSTLDLRFDPAPLKTPEGRAKFAGFLKGFVDLGVMTMQISMVDEETLRDAQQHPEKHPHLMVKVAGYSARFVELAKDEQEEIIRRTTQRL
jgi:pyruvate-formate lyase